MLKRGRSTLTQYGVVLLYMLESVASNSQARAAKRVQSWDSGKVYNSLERFQNKKKSSVAQTHTRNCHKGQKFEWNRVPSG